MKHLAIPTWLSQLGLAQYCTLFDQEYDGVEDLLHLNELDLLELGVGNHRHRIQLLTSIQILLEMERRRGPLGWPWCSHDQHEYQTSGYLSEDVSRIIKA
ncbi:hypothetical protein DPEC_G00341530 [Dallia pectoralis]|uniref:Uncharacterized protein n=1 Tax=Dallia pectoralis TaxID=75939 RepID=A0ACC2F5J4_DALPE|nr:hypothetical protein DPEC_G00341530 [Dallia pectoralis]